MNEIHIDRLDLKCRGIKAATVQAALRELGPALAQQLENRNRPGGGQSQSKALQVPARVTPSALATTVARQITAAIHAGTGRSARGGKT